YKLKSNANPNETVLEVPISIENAIVTIENMTIDVSRLVEAVAIHSWNSQLILNNVIIKTNNDCNGLVLEGIRSGSVFKNITVTKASQNLFSTVIKNGASVHIYDSLIENFSVIGGNAFVNNTLLVNTTSVYEKGVLRAENLFIENGIKDTYEIMSQENSKVFLDQLTLIEGNGLINLKDSTLELKSANLDVEQEKVRQMEGESQEIYYEDEDYDDLEEVFKIDEGIEEDYTVGNNEELRNEQYEKQFNSEEPISALEELENLIGLENVKQTTEKFINVAKINKIKKEKNIATSMPSLHSIFIGNPGTGKTTVARLIARALYEEGVVLSDNYVEV